MRVNVYLLISFLHVFYGLGEGFRLYHLRCLVGDSARVRRASAVAIKHLGPQVIRVSSVSFFEQEVTYFQSVLLLGLLQSRPLNLIICG